MSAAAAAVELFLNPVMSRTSDALGCRPLLLVAPTINFVLHSLVYIFPKNLAFNFFIRHREP